MNGKILDDVIKYGKHFSKLLGISVLLFDHNNYEISDLGMECFCNKCNYKKCDRGKTCTYGCNEAWRWGGKYIYYCPLGLVFCAVAVNDSSGHMEGGLIGGPFIIGQLEDTLITIKSNYLKDEITNLRQFTSEMANHLSEVFLSGVFHEIGFDYAVSETTKQHMILNAVYQIKECCYKGMSPQKYPIEYEKKLQLAVLAKNKQAARKLLGEMLSHIYISYNFEIETLRVRILEQIALLSRVAIDAGANLNEVLLLSDSYWNNLSTCQSIEHMNILTANMLDNFIDASQCFTDMKHTDIFYKAMEYIKGNYTNKITLKEVADHVGLNSAYLSTIFKQEMGCSLMVYIQNVRVEHSKTLLLDPKLSLSEVAYLCGFGDQSYFTKIFRRKIGVTPKYFRTKRGILLENE